MNQSLENTNYLEKIGNFDRVEILVNDRQEMEFEGIIDAVYIKIHFERILKSARYFDIVKLIGHHGKKSKEVIAEVIIGQ